MKPDGPEPEVCRNLQARSSPSPKVGWKAKPEPEDFWARPNTNYTLQRSPINGNPWWKHGVFGKKVIWFHDYGFWILSDFEELGKNIPNPDIAGPNNVDDWPNYITYGWRYYSNGWHEAGNDIIIQGKSISFLSLLQNKALK